MGQQVSLSSMAFQAGVSLGWRRAVEADDGRVRNCLRTRNMSILDATHTNWTWFVAAQLESFSEVMTPLESPEVEDDLGKDG